MKYNISGSTMHGQIKGWAFEGSHSNLSDKTLIEEAIDNNKFNCNLLLQYRRDIFQVMLCYY